MKQDYCSVIFIFNKTCVCYISASAVSNVLFKHSHIYNHELDSFVIGSIAMRTFNFFKVLNLPSLTGEHYTSLLRKIQVLDLTLGESALVAALNLMIGGN